VLDLSAKLYSKILGLAVMSDPKVILIITLNLHYSVGPTTIPDPIALDANLAATSCHKSVIIK